MTRKPPARKPLRRPPGQTRERVYELVRERILAGLPPTVREVQRALGLRAVQSAHEHLASLVAEGRLVKQPGKSRGYALPAGSGRETPTVFVPLLGRVQAGGLTAAVEEREGYLAVQSRLPRQSLFALRVRGESMTGVGILPGDVVIVRQQPAADPGDVVVALVEDEATVKTLRLRNDRLELHPENPAFAPIVPDPARFSLLGKVIEVRRYLEALPVEAPPDGPP